MKQNDWIIANINNPDFTISDFQYIADMNTENTQLLSYQDYTNKDFIKNHESFKDKNGDFDEDLFKQYYITKAQEFQQFGEFDQVDQLEYSIWDIRRTKDSKIKNPQITIEKTFNPDRLAIGIEGINTVSKRTKTVSEIAQSQKVFDSKTGEFLDYTPNDKALFKEGNIFKNIYNYAESLFSDPLVIAKYDQDETVFENGRWITHKKGQYKLNDEGTYYTETLNGRSVVGKEFISALDTITIDGSDINKYDFFDSDSIDKSAIGSTVKNLAAVAPLFFMGPIAASVYGGLFITKELAKTLPMLADVFTLFGEDQDSKLLNTIAAYGNKFTGSTSEYAKENLFSYENIANLISDVALQWSQQKLIANSIRNITGANSAKLNAAYAKSAQQYTEEADSMLRKALSGELSIDKVQQYIGTSINRLQDIPEMVQKGIWEKTPLGQAMLKKFLPEAEEFIAKRTKLGQNLSLAYMAMISNTDVYQSVLEHNGTQKEAAAIALGSMIGMFSVDKFLGLGELFFDDVDMRHAYRQTLLKESETLFEKPKNQITTKGLNGWIERGIQLGKNAVNQYVDGVKNKTLGVFGKAIGEGLEEVSEELVTDINKTLGEIAGEFGLASRTDYGAWDNSLERYAMSFVGGTLGGALYSAANTPQSRKTIQETIYYIRNNKTNELLSELEKLYKKGKLASTTLSTIKSEGSYITAEKGQETQNDFVYKMMRESILQMQQIINDNKLNISENQLFDQLVLSEARYLQLRDYLQDVSYITKYQQEYQNLIEELLNIENKITQLESETDINKREDSFKENLEKLKSEKANILSKKDKFLSGEYSAHYLKKLLFAIDTNLSSPFTALNYNQWVRHNYGKDVLYLTDSERKEFEEKYNKYKTNNQKKSLSKAFEIYEAMEQKLIPVINNINSQDVLSWGKVAEVFNNPLQGLKSWDDKLEGETNEDYENRNNKLETESPEEFQLRKSTRTQNIELENDKNLQNIYEEFLKGQGVLDSGIYRQLSAQTKLRKQDIIKSIIDKIYSAPEINNNTKLIKELSELLNQGQYEESVISNKIKQFIAFDLENQLKKQLNYYSNLEDLGITTDEITKRQIFEVLDSQNMDINADQYDTLLSELSEEEYEQLIKEYAAYKNGEQVNLEEVVGKSYNQLAKEVELEFKTTGEKALNYITTEIISELRTNKWLKIFDQLEQKLRIDANPVLQLLKITNPIFKNIPALEQQLSDIYRQWETVENKADFELTQPQLEALRESIDMLNYVKAFIYSASQTPTLINPSGHNQAINDFIQNNKIQNQQILPILQQDISNVYLSEIDRYIEEANFWKDLALKNSVNKVKEYQETDIALLTSRIDFYRNNNFILEDGTDLLEGASPIEEISLNTLVRLDTTLYNNFNKAINNGKKQEDILSELFGKITYIDNVVEQITTPINRELTYAKYSDYDKFTFLVSTLAISDQAFYSKLKRHIESNPVTKDGDKIVPLSTQEYVERVVEAGLHNPTFINNALDIISTKSVRKLPVVYNTTVVTGLGGSGKTQVIAKMNLSDVNPDKIWVAGPTEAQVNGLLEVFIQAQGKSREELMTAFLTEEDYKYIMSNINSDKNPSKFFDSIVDSNQRLFLNKNVKFKDLESKPEFIVIDEITHFSGVELQLLGAWAKENNIKLIELGDELQKGFEGKSLNIDRETILMWRAPRLGTTLRDSTYQKIKNLQQVINIADDLRTSLDLNQDKLDYIYNNAIPNISFKYYLDENKFSGELIADNINESHLKVLKGKIGYVGNNDTVYKQLKDSGLDIQIYPPDKIQGREFDFVIVNKQWELPKVDDSGLSAYRFLQDLYTMISRSKEGTIIIDNGLSNIIKNQQEALYIKADSIKDKVDAFVKYKLAELNSINLTESVEEQPKEQPQVKNKEIKEKPEITNQEEVDGDVFEDLTTKFPIRVYGNVHLLGVDIEQVNINGEKQNKWINKTGTKQDIGIFIPQNSEVVDGEEKDRLVTQLLDLKSALLFNRYDNLSPKLKDILPQTSLSQLQYYVQIKDSDHLIGETNLKQEGLTIDDKVITVICKFKDINGEWNSITLGALASPKKWSTNIDLIKSGINKRLAQEPNQELEDYVNNLNQLVLSYTNKIDEIKIKNQEIRINPPKFSSKTELIKYDVNGKRLPQTPLESMNSSFKPWKNKNKYAITSNVMTVIDPIPGSNLKPGSHVRYVTADRMLNINDLETIYWNQRENGQEPEVRLQVLNNVGVSFRSLFKSDYKELYTVKDGKNVFTFPIELQSQAMNMYLSMWNFRANLIKFNRVLEEWQKENSISNEELHELIKLESEAYDKTKSDLKLKRLSEEEFRKAEFENKDRISKLWEFNDSLANTVRQFRLGYSSRNGAYLRNLTNIKTDNAFYNKTDVVGIYINPEIASQYLNILNSLFENFLDKIIQKPFDSHIYIDSKQKGWFNQIVSQNSINVNLSDENNNKVVTMTVPSTDRLKAIPVLLTEMAKYIQFYSNDKEHFLGLMRNDRDDEKQLFTIKLDEENIDYISIFDSKENPIIETVDGELESVPGVHTFTTEKGAKQTMDFRINNLWDLMFHGSIENASNNVFPQDGFFADDAFFKYGIFSHPINYKKADGRRLGMVNFSEKFFTADTNVGFPIIHMNFSQFQETINSENVTIVKEDVLQLPTSVIEALNILGIEQNEVESVEEALEYIQDNVNQVLENTFSGRDDNSINWQQLITSVTLVNGELKYNYLKDLISENIIDYKFENGRLLLSTDSDFNNIITITYNKIDSEINILRKTSPINEEQMTGNQLLNLVLKLKDTYPNAFESPDINLSLNEDWDEYLTNGINEAFNQFINDKPLNKVDLNTILNNIQKLFEDDDRESTINLIETITDLKQKYCTI